MGAGSWSRHFRQHPHPTGVQLLLLLSTDDHGSPQRSGTMRPESGGHPPPPLAKSPRQQTGGFPSCPGPPEPLRSGTPALEEDGTNCIPPAWLLSVCESGVTKSTSSGLSSSSSHLRALGDGAAVAQGTRGLPPPCRPAPAAGVCWGHGRASPEPTHPPVWRAVRVPVPCRSEYGPYSSYSGVVSRMRKFIAKIGTLALPQGKRKGNYRFTPRVVFVRADLSKGCVIPPSTYDVAVKNCCVGIFLP